MRNSPKTAKQVRTGYQCDYGIDQKLALLKELKAALSNLKDFTSSDRARAAGLFYKKGDLYLQSFFCPYPMLTDVNQLKTKTWCQCTAEYNKVLLEKTFEYEVDVDLLKDIKSGDDTYLIKIIPRGLI